MQLAKPKKDIGDGGVPDQWQGNVTRDLRLRWELRIAPPETDAVEHSEDGDAIRASEFLRNISPISSTVSTEWTNPVLVKAAVEVASA